MPRTGRRRDAGVADSALSAPAAVIRPATLDDLDALVDMENRCFTSDRLSRRSFRHLLRRGHATTLVDEENGMLRGYILVLFHTGTLLARIYSIAVDAAWRGQGIAEGLVLAAEAAARDKDCVYIRLEVREDNTASLALFHKLGYRQFGIFSDYYEDHAGARRLEKMMVPHLEPDMVRVPYIPQSLEFTCGPAALMMAMHALDPAMTADRTLELRLWREATTIFMTSGHGGCGPFGLALSAYHRGFRVAVYVKDESALFVDSVRSEEKKEVIRLVQEDFIREIRKAGIPLHYRQLGIDALREEFERGGIPIVLISSYRIYREKFPHWVVVTGFDNRFIYVHDPYIDMEGGKTETDCVNMPILQKDFERMARYGKSGQRAVVILGRRR